jgi:hypothetical protein
MYFKHTDTISSQFWQCFYCIRRNESKKLTAVDQNKKIQGSPGLVNNSVRGRFTI